MLLASTRTTMKKTFIFILILLLGSFLFYWYQIRPTQIRHDCSWVKHHTDAVQARKGMTEDELRAKGMIKTCPRTSHSSFSGTIQPLTNSDLENIGCIISNQNIIDANKPQKYVPAKDWYEKATPQEYQFCLHDKGL